MIPVSRISGVLSSVLFPSLSLIQDDTKRVTSIFLKITRTIAFITFPLMIMLALGAKDFVETVLGEEWLEMIPILQLLSIVGAVHSVATLDGNIYLVKNRTDLAFKTNILNSSVYVIGFYISSQFSLTHLALVYMISTLILLLINWYIVEKLLEVKIFSLIKNITIHLIGFTLVLIIGYLFVLPTLIKFDLPGLINLIFIGLYVILLWLLTFLIFSRNI
jgi:PST family polysaccharide transporter